MPHDRSYRFVSNSKLKMSNSTEEDAVLVDMELSVYSQVVFIDVPHAYPLHSDVICSYKLTGGLTPNNKDWIGIYKVDAM